MTTILRKYHSVTRCTLLGEMIEDTAHRYYYRPRVGVELAFADKESLAIHLTPCPACPDWPADQQHGSAVGTELPMTSTLVVVGLVLAPPLGWLLGAWLAGRSDPGR
jgi:hypothetical protein